MKCKWIYLCWLLKELLSMVTKKNTWIDLLMFSIFIFFLLTLTHVVLKRSFLVTLYRWYLFLFWTISLAFFWLFKDSYFRDLRRKSKSKEKHFYSKNILQKWLKNPQQTEILRFLEYFEEGILKSSSKVNFFFWFYVIEYSFKQATGEKFKILLAN